MELKGKNKQPLTRIGDKEDFGVRARSSLIYLFFLVGCDINVDSLQLPSGSEEYQLKYPNEISLISGEQKLLSPTLLSKADDFEVSCHPLQSLPGWVSFDSINCSANINAIKVGAWGPYEVSLDGENGSVSATFQFEVKAPEENNLPAPATPAPIDNYYMTTSLSNDSNYFSSFSSTAIYFFDATNPYSVNLIDDLATSGLGHGQPQAIVSIGDYIYVSTNTGYILVYDWSERQNPSYVMSYIVDNGGQNYDLATDEENQLFVANTTHNRFAVIDVSDPSSPVLIYKFDDLDGFGAGVAFYNGVVYVTDFSGKIFTFQEVSGTWSNTGIVNTSFSGPHRPMADGGRLFVPKYGGDELDIFSLSSPQVPSLNQTILLDENISIYSRPLVHGGELYLTQQGSPAYFRIFEIPTEVEKTLVNFKTFEPICPDDDPCGDIMGPALFRNDSFISYIGVDASVGGNRFILTNFLPLHE